jgi:epoxyqueuosine reductase QueG
MALTQALKNEAHRLGFDLMGITTPDPPLHFSVYEQWIADGLQGEMRYLATDRARSRRADPRTIMSDCRSILVLGARYPAGASFLLKNGETISDRDGPGRGRPGNIPSDKIPPGKLAPGKLAPGKLAA